MNAPSIPTAFTTPQRMIYNAEDFEQFKKSEAMAEINGFVKACADAIVGKKNSEHGLSSSGNGGDSTASSLLLQKVVAFMQRLHALVDEIPPLKQPMRFGNKAFRQFHARLVEREAPAFLADLLPPALQAAVPELAAYLGASFGNETRIDYGTGHELSFAVFLLCLFKLQLLSPTPAELAATVLAVFPAYIHTMRRLQEDYMLEPAGSHGVWGLDDYHCLVFLWGSAQLVNNSDELLPSSVHAPHVLEELSGEYLYLEGIQFIKKIKASAPFAETSPMLNDISAMADWGKVCGGLVRLFQGEVLNKLPVVQHLLFGSLLQATWTTAGEERKSLPAGLRQTQVPGPGGAGMAAMAGMMTVRPGGAAAPLPMGATVFPGMATMRPPPMTAMPLPGSSNGNGSGSGNSHSRDGGGTGSNGSHSHA